jgi:hypothetical protein
VIAADAIAIAYGDTNINQATSKVGHGENKKILYVLSTNFIYKYVNCGKKNENLLIENFQHFKTGKEIFFRAEFRLTYMCVLSILSSKASVNVRDRVIFLECLYVI